MKNAMNALKTKLNVILDAIKDPHDVVYLDYPVYHNVGDLLIYAGALLLFKENGVRIRLKRSVLDASVEELRRVVGPRTTILCQGGGNFGDLYPAHQALRETVVEAFPDNRIIVLPQTLYFEDDANLAKTRAVFRKHKDVVIFSRDARSLAVFNTLTDKAVMAPDTAHYLYGELRVDPPNADAPVLYFLRTDKERQGAPSQVAGEPVQGVDWQNVVTQRDEKVRFWVRRVLQLGIRTGSPVFKNLAAFLWERHLWGMVHRSARLFSRHRRIVTSRMHGHILACLVDRDNTVIDNAYGKNSGYYHAWTRDVPGATLDKSGQGEAG